MTDKTITDEYPETTPEGKRYRLLTEEEITQRGYTNKQGESLVGNEIRQYESGNVYDFTNKLPVDGSLVLNSTKAVQIANRKHELARQRVREAIVANAERAGVNGHDAPAVIGAAYGHLFVRAMHPKAPLDSARLVIREVAEAADLLPAKGSKEQPVAQQNNTFIMQFVRAMRGDEAVDAVVVDADAPTDGG